MAIAVTAIAVTALAGGLLLRRSAPPTARRTAYQAGTVLLDLATGRQIGFVAPARLATSAYPIFSGHRFWVVDLEPAAFVEIDPRSGRVLKQITPLARDPAIHGDSASLTPFAVQGGTLWTTSGDGLVRMDIDLGREVERLHLDRYAGGAQRSG
jgi:hypothetical protein